MQYTTQRPAEASGIFVIVQNHYNLADCESANMTTAKPEEMIDLCNEAKVSAYHGEVFWARPFPLPTKTELFYCVKRG